MEVSFRPAEIIAAVEPRRTLGETDQTIRGIAALASASPGDLSFLGNKKYKRDVAATRASVVLLPVGFEGQPQPDQQFIFVDNPSAALARICARIEAMLWPKPVPGVHPRACVAATARVAPSATVGPGCVVDEGAVVGDDVHLEANVFLGRDTRVGPGCWLSPGVVVQGGSVLGRRVRLHPGVVIGGDGFGYEFADGRHQKVPQVGNVVIEDDVEVGANSTIDRARFSQTRIGEGTKIDNLVQIGHNVIVGKHCMICGQVGVSGSATIEDYVVLAGQAGVGGHITIGKGVRVGGQAAVNTDVAPGSMINGSPAMPYLLERRVAVLCRRLPDLFKRVDELEEQLKKSSS